MLWRCALGIGMALLFTGEAASVAAPSPRVARHNPATVRSAEESFGGVRLGMSGIYWGIDFGP